MNGRSILAWNIRRMRSERGISQERLAADAEIDRAYLSEIEREIGNATIDIMDRIAANMGVSLVDLVQPPAPDEPPPENLRPGRRTK